MDPAQYLYQYISTNNDVRQIQFTAWDEYSGTCEMTETRPDGTTLQFSWDKDKHQFEGSPSWSWKPANASVFKFLGVYPSLGNMGAQTYRVTGSSDMVRTSLIEVADYTSSQIFVMGWANGSSFQQNYIHGVIDVASKQLTWSGAFSAVWTYQGGDLLEDLPPQALTIFEAFQGSTVRQWQQRPLIWRASGSWTMQGRCMI